VLAPHDAAAQGVTAERIHWRPAPPMQGSLTVIEIEAPAAVDVSGELAGQPLHFERTSAGRFAALAGIPVTADSSLRFAYAITDAGGGRRERSLPLPIATAAFGVERLRVAPRFSAPPDSALAARIRSESARARRVSEASHGTPRLWSGPFLRPLPGRVTSPFGKGREFNGELQSRHMGTDFAGATGDSIRVVNHGRVALVGAFYYGGNVAYVDHGGGLVTAYLHMSEVLVREGDLVAPGTVLGLVGATGRVTGPHLHLITRYGTVTVNGTDLLTLDVSGFSDPHAATR
jgi:murein DD-endopeptidase MepM/ murein hydrolase activator NlpD